MSPSPSQRSSGRVSLIVTARNEAADIEACLRSLLAQDHPDTEVILVDNHSTDGTLEIARRLGVRVETAGPERSAQRNHGFRVSSGACVVFLDADMQAPPTLASEVFAALAPPNEAVAAILPEDSFGDGFWTQCKILERSCYGPEDRVEAARAYRAEVFESVGGYDETLTGLEDLDLSQRVERMGPIARTSTPIRHHEGRIRFLDQLRKKYRYGRLSAAYMRKHPADFRKQARVLRPGFLRHARRLARTPLLTAAMLFLKTSEILTGGLGLAMGWLREHQPGTAPTSA